MTDRADLSKGRKSRQNFVTFSPYVYDLAYLSGQFDSPKLNYPDTQHKMCGDVLETIGFAISQKLVTSYLSSLFASEMKHIDIFDVSRLSVRLSVRPSVRPSKDSACPSLLLLTCFGRALAIARLAGCAADCCSAELHADQRYGKGRPVG